MIRRISLVGGLATVVLLLCSAGWALYLSPRLPNSFAWDGQAWVVQDGNPPLQPGEHLSRLGGQPLTRYTFMVDNFALQSRDEMMQWFAEKERLYRALQADQVEVCLLYTSPSPRD